MSTEPGPLEQQETGIAVICNCFVYRHGDTILHPYSYVRVRHHRLTTAHNLEVRKPKSRGQQG